MNEQLEQQLDRFNNLSLRERGIVAGAILLGGLMLSNLLLIDPQMTRKATQTKRIAQTKNEMAAVEAQLTEMQAKVKDPDASNRAALQEIRKNMAAVDLRLHNIQDSLVPPDKMQSFLENLLSRNSRLELMALRTQAAAPLITHAAEAAAAKKAENKDKIKDKDASSPAKPDVTKEVNSGPGAGIYKHAIEIRIAGSYSDLTKYLSELENMPQRILWERAELSVDKFPRNILTVTVYTLSLDKQWLIL